MLARAVRSGLAESFHDGALAAIGAAGELLFEVGDIDRPFFYRSAIKPFQTTVVLEAGVELNREQTAVASSSHGGQPVHVAIVEDMLAGAGLDSSFLRCPPDWPLSFSARMRLAAAGVVRPEPRFHNCSGKHAAALVACLAQGWPVESYTEPDHPYQELVVHLLADSAEEEVLPVGVDGCGFPTLRGSVRGLAQAFAKLAFEDRFSRVREAMAAMPALTSDWDRPEGMIASWLPAAAKRGAVACAGVAVSHRFGLAGKCWDGTNAPLFVGLIEALNRLGALEPVMAQVLADHARPKVFGGGEPVGSLEPALG